MTRKSTPRRKMWNNKQIEPQKFDVDELFQFAMKKKWREVLRICKSHPSDACKAKLTKSEETALHIAVSSYHVGEKEANALAAIIRQLVELLPVGQAVEILKAENDKGDTALHLAAALGSVTICDCIARNRNQIYRELIMIRNRKGETPMFLAAHHGHMEAFQLLHELYNGNASEPDYSLGRRNDGDTILHSAISGEYFGKNYASHASFSLKDSKCINLYHLRIKWDLNNFLHYSIGRPDNYQIPQACQFCQ